MLLIKANFLIPAKELLEQVLRTCELMLCVYCFFPSTISLCLVVSLNSSRSIFEALLHVAVGSLQALCDCEAESPLRKNMILARLIRVNSEILTFHVKHTSDATYDTEWL